MNRKQRVPAHGHFTRRTEPPPDEPAAWPAWTPFAFHDTTEPDGTGKESLVYGNSRYTVIVFEMGGEGPLRLRHLSLHDHWRTARHDWRDLLRIKNELCGPECEAVEIYPPESRLVDLANQYHLFVWDGPVLTDLGIGFTTRLLAEADPTGGRQRPFDREERDPARDFQRRSPTGSAKKAASSWTHRMRPK